MPKKMKFHFRPKTKITCAYITELSYGSVTNITFSAQCKSHFWNENENKTKKMNFWPKAETAENDRIAHFRCRKRILVSF